MQRTLRLAPILVIKWKLQLHDGASRLLIGGKQTRTRTGGRPRRPSCSGGSAGSRCGWSGPNKRKVPAAIKETSDFLRKEKIVSELVHFLDANDPHDFYFLLDCDESLAYEMNGEPYFDKKSILDTLNLYINYKKVLFIGSKYWHNSFELNMYYIRTMWSRKCFFTRGTLKSLTGRFHGGESISPKKPLCR